MGQAGQDMGQAGQDMGQAGLCTVLSAVWQEGFSGSIPTAQTQTSPWQQEGIRPARPPADRPLLCRCLPALRNAHFQPPSCSPGSCTVAWQPEATRKFIRLVKLQGSNLIVSISPRSLEGNSLI